MEGDMPPLGAWGACITEKFELVGLNLIVIVSENSLCTHM